MNKLGLFCLSLSFMLTGCGGGGAVDEAPVVSDTPVAQDLSAIKATLEDIAKTGVVNSAMLGLPEGLEKAGKPELAKEANKLNSMKGEKKIKAAAKKIADQL